MVEVLQRGDWSYGDPHGVVVIDVRRHALCDFEITILMRSATSPEAKRWRFERLVYWDAGTAHIDTDQSDDSQRALGTELTWQAPTIGIDPDQRLAVAIDPSATEGSFGTWIVRVNNRQRSVF